ncbi:MAG TPA: MBL fold metallo-hydrolase [Aquihabitans sp.]|jgi:flavorubredoxin|nr:MBL fold metallo-hydrolase [Aquihabitans sp.]
MTARVDEIAPDVFRISTLDDGPAGGFTFNQFLLRAEEPVLVHSGPAEMFDGTLAAVARLLPVERLRWLSYSHVEGDESGAVPQWLGVAPHAQLLLGASGSTLSTGSPPDRTIRTVEEDEVVDLGGKRLRVLPTPHVPHGWDAALWFEEDRGTLLASDLFTQPGDGPAVTDDDLIERSMAGEELFGYTAPTTLFGPTVRRLAELPVRTIACMHGSSFDGHCPNQLRDLADAMERRFATSA